jgi:hypothetical protein
MHFYRNNTKNKVIPIAITKAIHIFFATFIVNFGEDRLLAACDKIQPGILFMILKSEGDKIKFCSAPERDRKYVIAAYINLVCNKPGSFLEDSLKTVVTSIIELAAKSQSSGSGFQMASLHEGSAEEMLMDGAIDQTFAFQRQTHIQLHSAKTEQADKLANDVPVPEAYLVQKLSQFTQQQNTSVSSLLASEKAGNQLGQLCQTVGI